MKIYLYSWKARSAEGRLFSGRLQAASPEAAASLLRKRYGYVVALKRCAPRQGGFRLRTGFTDKQRMIFFRQLAVILNSGIPLLQGIELLRGRLDTDLGQVCDRLLARLRDGSPLHMAMAADEEFFPQLAVTLTAAGESGGELQFVLEAAAEYYCRQHELKSFLYKSAAYPVFLLASAVAVAVFFLLYVLPELAAVYASMQAEPDAFLQGVLWLNGLAAEYALLMTACAAGGTVLLWQKRQVLYRMLWNLPVLNSMCRLVAEIRFCKLLALLLNSGLNITEAAEEAGKVFTDYRQQAQLYLFRQKLLRGVDIGAAAQQAVGIFSPLTAEFVNVGAATGCLPQMLADAADIMEQELQGKLERFRELFAPVLLLVAALLTALVVCSVMGPLFDLFTTLPEYG